MNERKVINWCIGLFIIVLTGVLIMTPTNVSNTVFVVWPPEVLREHGYVQPLTYGELILTEGLRLSPSQISAFESGPSRQGNIAGIATIISAVRVRREPESGEKWGREDPSETTPEAARARREGTKKTSTSELGMPVEDAPSKEPTSTRRAPRRRPIPQ